MADTLVSRAPADPTDEIGRFAVADAGVGFDPTRLRVAGGTEGGFGLLGIRERLEGIGGRLELESTPGSGSRVTLVAPLDRTAVAPATPLPAVPAEAESGSRAARRLRVLVVEDSALVRRGIATLLQGESDLEVVGEADNGQRAIELTRQLTPDVILMDVSMPVMNGVDATRAIHEEFPSVRVIGLSMLEEAQSEAMLQAGAVGYLRTSDSAEALLAVIRGGGAGR
jgi:CheY-like chemotaxis protein